MTDRLPDRDLYRRTREQVLRTESGPPSTSVELPAALRGLLRDDNATDDADAGDDDEGDDE